MNSCGGCGILANEPGTTCELLILSDEPDACHYGLHACDPNNSDGLICEVSTPTSEICDNMDNDCDSFIDEDFNLWTDVNNCGDCGVVCDFPNAYSTCTNGACNIDSCVPGWADNDGLEENGCEAPCTSDGSALDPCDGFDNDCDGLLDEDYEPTYCGEGICEAVSICDRGTIIECAVGTPEELPDEVTCDGNDNDCDGRVDEGISIPCTNDCGSGEMVCNNGEFPACSTIAEDDSICIDISFFCETIPVDLELTLPTAEEELGVDLVFVFDRSGSFWDDLSTFQSKANELTAILGSEILNLGVGLSSFVDAPCYDYGSVGDFGYEVNLPITTDLDSLSTVLYSLDIRSGNDEPESQLEALYQTLTGEGVTTSGSCASALIPPSDIGWRSSSVGFMFLSTDASFHYPTGTYPYPHDYGDVILAALDRGIQIFFLQAAGLTDTSAYTIATETGGEVYNLTSDSSGMVEAVTSAVFESLANAEVRLEAEGDENGFVTDIFPEYLTGIDLFTNSTVNLTVTLLSPVEPNGEEQSFNFDLVFYVNDAEVSRRPVTVTIPAEDPKDCVNRPPIIRELYTPSTMTALELATLNVVAEEPDGNPVSYLWSASGGTLATPESDTTSYTAPSLGGLVELNVTASDYELRNDQATTLIHIKGDQCQADANWIDVGIVGGRLALNASRGVNYASGSCGGSSEGESLVILTVHEPGDYLISLEPAGDFVIHVKDQSCITELYCTAGNQLEVSLDEDNYFLFIDANSSTSSTFDLFIEPI